MHPAPLPAPTAAPGGRAPPRPRSALIARAALVLAVAAAYLPVWRAGFVWDDAAHVTAPALRSWAGLLRLWTEPGVTQQYYPLLHSLFWLEHRLWGDAALGYHLANLALHLLAAVLLWRVLHRLAIRGAHLAALVFALHPVNAESVAWISEQKNTLSTALYLAAALACLRVAPGEGESGEAGKNPASLRSPFRSPSWWLATALFAGALLAKTVTATLPAALLVVQWWRRGRLEWRRDVAPLVPWLALGLGAGLFTVWAERHLIGAEGAAFDLGGGARLALAGRGVWFYLGKLAWPHGLAFIYPRWDVDPGRPAAWLPLGAALALTVVLWRLRHRTRAPLAAWLLFVGALFPALGFFNVYPFRYSFVADHFQYLASPAPLALAAAGFVRLVPSGRLRALLVASLALALAGLTWLQAATFRDAATLFRATLRRNPAAWMAHNNLGELLMKNPATRPEAIACFERALALHPGYFEAQNNLGLALAQAGRPRDALPHLAAALRLKPASFQTLNNLGIALAGLGRADEAVDAFRRAVRLNPALPNLHENLAKALTLLGRADEAAAERAEAARLRAAAPAAR